MSDIVLTDIQNKAVDGAIKFIKNFKPHQSRSFYFINGYAGTGKTTIMKYMLDSFQRRHFRIATFTGKAAKVVKSKTGYNCQTIHSLIYTPLTDRNGNIIKWILNRAELESSDIKFIVLDEVSMVGDKMWNDLLSFNKPIVVFGDTFQLPPVSGREIFTTAMADITLTEIHRQALENPIVRLSMDIREGKGIPLGNHGDKVIKIKDLPEYFSNEEGHKLQDFEQIICGKNDTRKALNDFYRKEILHIDSQLPKKDEKIIVLKNNQFRGLMNGEILTTESNVKFYNESEGIFTIITDFDKRKDEKRALSARLPFAQSKSICISDLYDGKTRERIMASLKRENDNRLVYKAPYLETDFAYAITCHKSQGSQYESGIIFDESYIFRDNKDRWLYTALTRFVDKCIIVQC